MEKLNLILVLIISFFLSSMTYSQYKEKKTKTKVKFEDDSRNYIGAAIGISSGYGLAYQYKPNDLSFQVNFAPYKEQNYSHYNVGLTFIYRLKKYEKVNLFVYQANSFNHEEFIKYYPNSPTPTIDQYFNNGIGIGFEFLIKNRFTFNLMGGYGGRRNFEEIKGTVEVGLFFKI